MANPEPVVGDWYRTADGERFEVVAVDEDEGTVEIQYYGGDIDELDMESWQELDLEPIAPDEDWSGPFDDLEKDDLGYTDMNSRPEGHGSPLDELEEED